MVVGVARLELRMPENASLKDKRRVVRSLVDRVRARFNVAVAEIAGLDSRQRAVIGVVCISNAAAHADAMLNEVIGWIDRATHGQMVWYETELR